MKSRSSRTNHNAGCLLSLALLFIITPLYAEEAKLTIDEAVEMALKNNLSLKGEERVLRTKRRTKNNSWNSFLPRANASVSIQHSDRLFASEPPVADPVVIPGVGDLSSFFSAPDVDPVTLNLGLNLSLRLNLSVYATIQAALHDYHAGVINYERTQDRLARDVKKNYYNLISLKENITLIEKNMEISKRRYEQVKSRFERGSASELSVLSAQTNYEILRPSHGRTQRTYETLKENFLLLLGAEFDTEFALIDEVEVGDGTVSADEYLGLALLDNPDIKVLDAQLRLLSSEKEKALYAGKTPSVDLGVNWASAINDPGTAGSWEEGTWQDRLTLTFGVTVPLDGLIPGSQTDVAVKGLEDTRQTLKQQRKVLEKSKEVEIRSAVRSINSIGESIRGQFLAVELAKRNYEMAEEAYRVGARDSFNVEEAQNRLFSAEQELLSLRFEYALAHFDLEYALGK